MILGPKQHQTNMINIKTQQQIEDFTRGCCFYATGGGGDPLFGQRMLQEALDAGKNISIVDADEILEDAWTVCPYLMGPAPGPESKSLQEEKEKYGLSEEVVMNMPAAAVRLLLKREKIKLDAVIPLEMGGASTASAVATAAWFGVPVIDGDYEGRALPEITQMLSAIHNHPLFPLASCDAHGNEIIIERTINQKMSERFGKLIATGSFGLVGQATLLTQFGKVKHLLSMHTLSKAMTIGSILRNAREKRVGSVEEIMEVTGAKVVFNGCVTKRKAEIQDGYYVGDIFIEGSGSFKNNQLRVWFKNENILSWINGDAYIACPDLITMIDHTTFEPIINGKLEEGAKVIVFAIKAAQDFLTDLALHVLGPKHFGFDFQPKQF